jgi:hypothetical protein
MLTQIHDIHVDSQYSRGFEIFTQIHDIHADFRKESNVYTGMECHVGAKI